MTIRCNANLFRIAAAYRSTEEVRYYLAGVYVEPHSAGGCILTATDGHRLFTVYDRAGECTEAAIISLSRTMLSSCKTPRRKERQADMLLTVDAGVAIVGTAEGAVLDTETGAVVDGTFPDWRRVIPRDPASLITCISLEGRCLAGVGETATALHAKAVIVGAADKGSPLLVQFDAITPADVMRGFPDPADALAVIMPIRGPETASLPQHVLMAAAAGPALAKAADGVLRHFLDAESVSGKTKIRMDVHLGAVRALAAAAAKARGQ